MQVINAEIDFPSTSCITVTLVTDAVPEPNEIFTVVLSTLDPAVILGDVAATVLITDDSQLAPIGIEFPIYLVGEADGDIEVCVVADGQLTQSVEVFLLSQDVSATSGTGGEWFIHQPQLTTGENHLYIPLSFRARGRL